MSASLATLQRWLDKDPGRLERYLARHPEAADALDRATELAGDVRDALASAVSVPTGLAERLLADVRGAATPASARRCSTSWASGSPPCDCSPGSTTERSDHPADHPADRPVAARRRTGRYPPGVPRPSMSSVPVPVRWLIGLAIVVAAVVVASVASKVVTRVLGSPSRPERLRTLADATGKVVFSVLLGVGLMTGLGVASPDDVRDLPGTIIGYVPRLLVALIVVLLGSAVATIVANAVGEALVRATGRPQPVVVRATRIAVIALSAVLAISQIGINTRVVDTIVAATIWSIAVTVGLLTVAGGRDVATHLSSGRYVRRVVQAGDEVDVGGVQGRVVAVHGVTIEIEETASGTRVHLPHRVVLEGPLRIAPRPTTTGG